MQDFEFVCMRSMADWTQTAHSMAAHLVRKEVDTGDDVRLDVCTLSGGRALHSQQH